MIMGLDARTVEELGNILKHRFLHVNVCINVHTFYDW